MATNKTFTVAGVSLHNGVFKVRYANSVKRAAHLAKNGHTDILMVELPWDGRKEDCVDALLNLVDDGTIAGDAAECVLTEAREFGFIV